MDPPDDPFDLQRFVDAQAPLWPQVRAELIAGTKRSHWMWFVFPQLASLGRSETARYYGIRSREEALAYAGHALLGPRLLEACTLVIALPPGAAPAAFGPVDTLKLRSCLTLFATVTPERTRFGNALDRHFAGERCAATVTKLSGP
jgi:uncharacterized protein (DUF1810 family)